MQLYQKEKQMANDKLDAFMKKQKDFAQDFEDNQKSVGTEPLLKDLTAAFHKNRNEVEIGERTYVIKKFGIRATMNLIPVLGKSFLVPLSALFRQGGGGNDSEEGIGAITEGLYMLFENIANEQLFDILEILLENTTYEGKTVNLDEDFDDIADVFQVCVKVLEINFSNFLKSLGLTELSSWAEGISKLQK